MWRVIWEYGPTATIEAESWSEAMTKALELTVILQDRCQNHNLISVCLIETDADRLTIIRKLSE